ncbi:MAG: hypothetical protein AB7S41_02110 [Parvibaculaceae bacterium]
MFEYDMFEAEFTSEMGEPPHQPRRDLTDRRELGLRLLTVAEAEAERRLPRR